VGDSRELDFTIRNGILKADFLKTGRKNGIESPLSTFFCVDRNRRKIVITIREGVGDFFQKEGNHE
jgi:hypothetical protein